MLVVVFGGIILYMTKEVQFLIIIKYFWIRSYSLENQKKLQLLYNNY
jgi:hypothetical protein